MTENNYDEERELGLQRNLRLQGIYYAGKNYINGTGSFGEALEAFRAFKKVGNLQLIQVCQKRERITIWKNGEGWAGLERNILKIK